MMLETTRISWAFALAAALAAGCGGEDTQGSSGTGGEGGTTSTSATIETTESTTTTESTGGSGGGLNCEPGEGPVLAVSKLSFGEGGSEWKKLGFDIDGLQSTAISLDVCQLNASALPTGPYPDGDKGIDNSFGKNLLPLILSLYPNWANDINNGITDGYFTSLMKMECLPEKGDAPKFTSKLFGGTTLEEPPKWDGNDKWPVKPELLSDPKDPLSSTILFEGSSVVGNQYDAGTGTFILTVPLKANMKTVTLKLTLYQARVTMTLSEDRKTAKGGIIGGVLNTEELVAEVKKVGYLMNLCDEGTFQNILDEVRRASDIMDDGTQDPTKTCNGISMGLAFEMVAADIGEVGPDSEAGMACP